MMVAMEDVTLLVVDELIGGVVHMNQGVLM